MFIVHRLHPECALSLPGMRGQDAEEEKQGEIDPEERAREDNANVG